ncbi:hypothetical protein ACFL1Y_01080 [Patescibacteria group bacterium]
MKHKFPYQIHVVLGLIWVLIGIFLYTGAEMLIWVGGGLVMLVIGLLNRKAD